MASSETYVWLGMGSLQVLLVEARYFQLWLARRHAGSRERVIPWALARPDWVTSSQGQKPPRDMEKAARFLLRTELPYQLGS